MLRVRQISPDGKASTTSLGGSCKAMLTKRTRGPRPFCVRTMSAAAESSSTLSGSNGCTTPDGARYSSCHAFASFLTCRLRGHSMPRGLGCLVVQPSTASNAHTRRRRRDQGPGSPGTWTGTCASITLTARCSVFAGGVSASKERA